MFECTERPGAVPIHLAMRAIVETEDVAGTSSGGFGAISEDSLRMVGDGLHAANQPFRRFILPISRDLGCRTVMWTLIAGDWQEKPAEWLIRRMQPIADHAQRILGNGSKPTAAGTGDVLCLHDGAHRQMNGDRSRTLRALEHWLPRWRDLGLEFVTIGEAVSTPAP